MVCGNFLVLSEACDTHPQPGECCMILCHLDLRDVTLQLESGLEQSVSS